MEDYCVPSKHPQPGLGRCFRHQPYFVGLYCHGDDFLDSGLRQFYFPADPSGGQQSYNWSFLRPTAELTLPEGESEIDLPDDFGGVEGRVILSPGDSAIAAVLRVGNEGYVRQMIGLNPSLVGRPAWCAVCPSKGTTAGRSPRATLLFFPTPDVDYTVELQYYLIPEALTAAHPYAYGGAMHAETLIEAGLAIAEQRLNNEMGVHTAKYAERLSASIAMDRRLTAQSLGYNGDTSDGFGYTVRGRNPNYWTGQSVLFDGQEWGT